MTLASSIGGIYGIFAVIFSISGILSYILAFGISLIMCLTAFGTLGSIREFLKQSALVWGCGALLGGIMTALLSFSKNPYTSASLPDTKSISVVFIIGGAAAYFAIRTFLKLKDRRTVFVTAVFRERSVTFSALCDSGNLMRDPISGDPVIPVSKDILSKLCSREVCSALLFLDTDILARENISMRLIPHRTDTKSDIIAGFIPDSVTVFYEKRKNPIRCVLCPRDCRADHYAGHAATVPASIVP